MAISKKIQEEALRLVEEERTAWEDAIVRITPKASMKIKDAIQTFRKNYQGMYSKQEMNETHVWIPVTEEHVENAIKAFDLDQKDINFRAVNKKGRQTTAVVRSIVKNRLDHKFFGQDLDQAERSLAIDGTVVWKVWKGENEFGKMDVMYKQVDLLNFYIDPHAETIQSTNAVIERVILPVEEVKADPELVNTDDLQGKENLAMDGVSGSQDNRKVKEVELFERHGKMPRYFLTGNKKHTEMIDGRIVISGRGDSSMVHLIAENTNNLKPYEEAWYTRVPGQWYGRGIAQKVLGLQTWANMVKNIHITRQKVAQLGIMKVKKGSGITPQMLKGLTVNGAISVNNMDDIEQMAMQEASAAHYRDMDDIRSFAQAVTSSVGAISPENLPASAPATTSVINDRNNKSSFTLIREGIGFWLQRLMDRHMTPIILATTSVNDIIAITGDDEAVQDIIERIVAKEAMKKMQARFPQVPTEQELAFAMERAKSSLKKSDILLELKDSFNPKNYEMRPTKSFITNEEMDTAVMVQNMLSLLQIAPEAKAEIVKDIYDLMGMDAPKFSAQQPQTPEPQKTPLQAAPTLQGVTTQANTNVGRVV